MFSNRCFSSFADLQIRFKKSGNILCFLCKFFILSVENLFRSVCRSLCKRRANFFMSNKSKQVMQ